MTYSVKEIFYTLQGEGAQAGRPAVFCRFSGCNLWSGQEEDRIKSICQFCDTDFVGTDGSGGGKFPDADSLAQTIKRFWSPESNHRARPYVVCTGGEPLLQLDGELVDALHDQGFEVAIETNGTCEVATGIDWVCVSPKAGADLIVLEGDELKLVFPQNGLAPEDCEQFEFDHFFLQPMDGPAQEENTRKAIDYCMKYPQWRLSIQMHKIVGIE